MSESIYFQASCPWCGVVMQVSDFAGECDECGCEWKVVIQKGRAVKDKVFGLEQADNETLEWTAEELRQRAKEDR